LYMLWNRMSAGSYLPRPVRVVEIPKDHGTGVRVLGVPTVVDRIAQTAAAMLLEEKLEPIFHPDSDGYRPGRDGHDALAKARQRCWRQDWVLDLDIRAFFDSVPHGLLKDMVRHHTELRWVLLYIERWLTAPMQMPDGTLVEREKGTPQGSPISPLLANLFLHYAFDTWMANRHPSCPFERYADDVVVHCDTERQARNLWAAIANRLGAFYRSALYSLARHIDEHLVRWAMHKFKRLRGKFARAWAWLNAARQRQPRLFAHWVMLPLTQSRSAGAV